MLDSLPLEVLCQPVFFCHMSCRLVPVRAELFVGITRRISYLGYQKYGAFQEKCCNGSVLPFLYFTMLRGKKADVTCGRLVLGWAVGKKEKRETGVYYLLEIRESIDLAEKPGSKYKHVCCFCWIFSTFPVHEKFRMTLVWVQFRLSSSEAKNAALL